MKKLFKKINDVREKKQCNTTPNLFIKCKNGIHYLSKINKTEFLKTNRWNIMCRKTFVFQSNEAANI